MMTTTPQDAPRDGEPEHAGRARQVREARRPQPGRQARTHLSMAGLRARGWTAALVRRLLGEPDLLRPHPLFRTARQIRLYRVERVEAAERGDEFRAVAAAAARRTAEARTTALRRRRTRRRPGTAGLGKDDARRRRGPRRIRVRARLDAWMID
ncbi:hypothetical protein [Streptomyces sp. JB150]|uniref:hypothetical protein n=1 Tax=Streptomyces sp. JB150 TaxID=2714844 RepID=UPI0019CFB549|nr:hypothetical protein [Streptomyces sp. JB150]